MRNEIAPSPSGVDVDYTLFGAERKVRNTSISQLQAEASVEGVGVAVLIHNGVGKIEPGTLIFNHRSGKLVVKTNRTPIFGIFKCCGYRYHEFTTEELDSIPRRVYSVQLHQSIMVLSAGDNRVREDLLHRSMSLVARWPRPDAVDITLPTSESQKELREWADRRLAASTRPQSARQSTGSLTPSSQPLSPPGQEGAHVFLHPKPLQEAEPSIEPEPSEEATLPEDFPVPQLSRRYSAPLGSDFEKQRAYRVSRHSVANTFHGNIWSEDAAKLEAARPSKLRESALQKFGRALNEVAMMSVRSEPVTTIREIKDTDNTE